MSLANFSFPTAIQFGPGSRKEVRKHLQEQGLSRPLIVTDRALAALPVLSAATLQTCSVPVAGKEFMTQ